MYGLTDTAYALDQLLWSVINRDVRHTGVPCNKKPTKRRHGIVLTSLQY